MEPYYNPVLTVSKLLKKLKELENSSLPTKEAKTVKKIYQEQIINAKAHILLLPDKYAFHIAKDGYNELARFVNKQLFFSAFDLPVNDYEVV